MKKCPMCGSAAVENAAVCFECLYSFDQMSCAAMMAPARGSVAVGGQPESFDVLVDDPDCGHNTYSLSDGALHVGRLPSNDIVVSDPMVSRRHLRLFIDRGQVWAEVIAAKNPPRLNGEPFRGTVKISTDDVIHVRRVTIQLAGTCERADDTLV